MCFSLKPNAVATLRRKDTITLYQTGSAEKNQIISNRFVVILGIKPLDDVEDLISYPCNFLIKVTSNSGNTYHHADQVDSGQFAFSAVEAGDYMACFSAVDHKPEVTLSIDFEWRTGVQSKSWATVAKKSQVEVMEFDVKSLLDTVNSIHEEMFYLREREEEMQDLNRSTNAKMAWLSFLSLFVCIGVAGMQYMHLKTFFEKKKVI
ncbi:unnamed protein product [Thlaspi arvense]|uniref:GOLD domain-containing protein n=1 Tax=Thlaspi arvense TaxID=13288 RepID=A0AAU9SHU0_THLAR|nr:unnamed protein product [Thlaspi arvense]